MIVKMEYKIRIQCLIGLLCVGMSLFIACKDDVLYSGEYGSEGEPVTISLKWSVPEMDVRSRAEMSDDDAAKVNDLWVGIYNVATGECTYNQLYEGLSTTDVHTAHLLKDITTKTGNSYIVAVANAMTNFGISDGDESDKIITVEGYDRGKGDYIPLHLLLNKANTWDKYLSISSVLTTPTNVDRFSADLVMNGVFHSGTGDDGVSWAAPKPVYIPASKSSDVFFGYIHLQRLIAYNKFTIKAGLNVTVEPISWQVYNNPVMSYLQEREGDINSADQSLYFVNANKDGYTTNHSVSNPSYIFGKAEDGDGYVFDFYQYENKQTAVEYAESNGNYVGINPDGSEPYADREREFKASDGTNTGVYRSLCNTDNKDEIKPGGVNRKNFASYVTFKAKVSYYVGPVPDDYQIPAGSGYKNREDAWAAEAKPVDPSTSNAMLRTGYTTYTVHLGYCEEKEDATPTLATARDFHCRRNTKYDYTVTVNGLQNIVVEAISSIKENNSGAEGEVTDAGKSQVIELDAHYGVFNIQLTNEQRNNLRWRITVPYGNKTYTLKWPEDPGEETGTPAGDVSVNRKNKFYNWIRFKPAPEEKYYAIYRENNISDEDADNALWTLEDLRNVADHPGIDAEGRDVTTEVTDRTPRYYTVFVDEHVYEEAADETGTNWKNYVDIGDRTVWLNTDIYHESDDKESVYMQSQYMITQKSIQTYYNRNSEGLNAILGMEYENESYGLNLRWRVENAPTPNGTYTDGNGVSMTMNGWNADNGRWNEWYYLSTNHTITNPEGKDWNGTDGILQNTQTLMNKTFIPRGVSPAIGNRQNENKPETYPAVYALQPFTRNWSRSADPTDSREYYDILSVCMNRNRDLNGNGKIDKNELKWYLPASGKYLRMILGRHSMKTPLMDYDGTPSLPNGAGSYDNTRYHYATSDKIILWAEEGVSTSDCPSDNNGSVPWQVRCVRNLGVDLNRILNNDPVQQAYKLDEQNKHIVVLEYYDASSIRGSIAGYLPVHTINENTNMVAKRFEYAIADCNSENTTVRPGAALTVDANGHLSSTNENLWLASANENQICSQYSQNGDGARWRVPNQKELTIMRRLGVFTQNDVKWLSCTQEYYGNRFFGVTKNISTVGSGNVGNRAVRCVRDVIGQ